MKTCNTNSVSETAYLAATFTSVFLAVSLTRMVPRLPFTPSTRDILAKLVPFASVASAGVVKYVLLVQAVHWATTDH